MNATLVRHTAAVYLIGCTVEVEPRLVDGPGPNQNFPCGQAFRVSCASRERAKNHAQHIFEAFEARHQRDPKHVAPPLFYVVHY